MLDEKSGGAHRLADRAGGADGGARRRDVRAAHAPGVGAEEDGRLRKQGWQTARIQAWEDIVPFAREFSRRAWGGGEGEGGA